MAVDRKKALIAGTFDPITSGHEDVIRRAAEMFDEVYVSVVVNDSKSPLFTAEERVALCNKVFADDPRIKIVADGRLLSEVAETYGCGTIVKGLRNTEDFVYEYEHAQIYRGMTPSLETVFIPSKAEFMHVSSTAVKAITKHGGNAEFYVPKCIYKDVCEKIKIK